ncbi:MAG: hypothetical protein PHH49_02760 [Candidatus Omnitrophica bacterium]|nr:hypothetical protein [Candidatus Omnitrophota bacterium]MDD5487870.1 hypothetical protein [Candidatus Omnitrophota bacterium]
MAKTITYDFAINWNSPYDSFFARALKEKCLSSGISFLWIHYFNREKILHRLNNDRLRLKCLMDTEATYEDPDDIYSKICYAAKDSGGFVFNDPDSTQLAIDKAYMYHRLVRENIPVPYTVIIRKWDPKKYTLTQKDKEKLGVPFIIKPARGYAQKGLVRNATGSAYQIRKARSFDPDDSFLLQEKVIPASLDGKRAWFRVLKVFDKIILFWWDDTTCVYRKAVPGEIKKYGLSALVEMTALLGDITGMTWFSTEFAGVRERDKLEFVSIDPINDQCDLTPRSEKPNGVPDNVVLSVADHILKNIKKITHA